jgi:hypothetical protein
LLRISAKSLVLASRSENYYGYLIFLEANAF